MTKENIDKRTLLALVLEWVLILAIISICIQFQSVLVWAIGSVLLASRQHALLALYHDAVHGLLAKNAKLNDFLINCFAGVPMLLPVEIFRPLHFSHHRELGLDGDPERTILYAEQHWRYHPLPLIKLTRQLLADLFLINAFRTIRAWKKQGGNFSPNPVTFVAIGLWVTVLALLGFYQDEALMKALLFWILTAFTLTNVLQKLRSYSEHGGPTQHTNALHNWTYSWQPGWLGRLTIWPYNINHHREHHDRPSAPWYHLPSLAKEKTGIVVGRNLWSLLHNSKALRIK